MNTLGTKPLFLRDKSDALLPMATTISVRFVLNLPVNIQIKHCMRTKIQSQKNEMFIPNLFQIAAQLEDFIVSPGLTLGPMPFAELMLNPTKLEAVLNALGKKASLAH
jgi:hypothetical protein